MSINTQQSEWFLTIGNPSQIESSINGEFLKGRSQPRVAMIGRSNVGKSSLINALMKKKFAQTSAQPGKTRLLHFYYWAEAKKILADLPGYGFAKAAKTDRERWSQFINAYLTADPGLERALILLDARHGPTPLDEEAIRFMDFRKIPVNFIFTKSDQIKNQSERARRKKEANAALQALGYDPKEAFWVSINDDRSIEGLAKALGVGFK